MEKLLKRLMVRVMKLQVQLMVCYLSGEDVNEKIIEVGNKLIDSFEETITLANEYDELIRKELEK